VPSAGTSDIVSEASNGPLAEQRGGSTSADGSSQAATAITAITTRFIRPPFRPAR
jgi:hypothetical protein